MNEIIQNLENELKDLTSKLREGDMADRREVQAERTRIRADIGFTKDLRDIFIKQLDAQINREGYVIMVGSKNIHFLSGDGKGMLAVDCVKSGETNRGTRRIVFDVRTDENGELKFLYRGYTSGHNYQAVFDAGNNFFLGNKMADNFNQSLYMNPTVINKKF
jgi:hypothetical protein